MAVTSAPNGVVFGRDHLWVRVTDGTGRVGLTDFAQANLGDVVDISLPGVGDHVTAGQACGDIESTKSVNDLTGLRPSPTRPARCESPRDRPKLRRSGVAPA